MRSSSSSRKPLALLAAAALAVVLAPALAARADNAAAANASVAANAGVGVARLSVIQGSVAVQRGDSGTASAAVINAPVLGADYVTTGAGSRAEIQFDDAAAVRLGAGVQMRFARLDANDRELQLAEGTIALRLLRDGGGAQVDTPSVSVRPRTSGSYRVTVDGDGRTQVTVRSGRADVITPAGAQALVPGTTLLAQGAASDPSTQTVAAIASDDFDRFNAERDARAQRAPADAYAPPGVAGIDDLAAYGRWVNDAGYGTVWSPAAVAPGWAPYRDGRWVWEDGGYGWTWIGYEPWGWAPYHYGRWYHSRSSGWCWVPARAVVPWSPALVTFLTFGGGSGLGFDTIGWLPLAPFEPFTPWWGYGGTTIAGGAFSDDDRHRHHRRDRDGAVQRPRYQNAQYGAGTAISKQRFLEGRFERPIALTTARMRSVQPVGGPLRVVPSDANLRFDERPVPAPLAVSATTLQRTFAGSGVATRRTPIDQQRAALLTVAHPATPLQPHAANATNPASAWKRFDTSSASRPAAAQAPRAYVERREAPGTYAAPHPPRNAAPAPANAAPAPAYPNPGRAYADPPAYANPVPARANANPPARSEQPSRRTPAQHHQR